MATFRIEFAEESGIDPQEQTVEADGVNDWEDAYRFFEKGVGTVRIVVKEYVVQVVRE